MSTQNLGKLPPSGQSFGLSYHSEKDEAENQKNDWNLQVSAVLDQPYLNTTKVNPKFENKDVLWKL